MDFEQVDVSQEFVSPEVRTEEPTLAEDLKTLGLTETGDTPLHGARQPFYSIKYERTYHRVIIYLLAQGLTFSEVAQKLGMGIVTVSNLARQPWAEKMILELQKDAGKDAVELTFKGAALEAARRLIAIANDDEVNPEVRRKANNDILDRVYGKAVQPMEHKYADVTNVPDEELLRAVSEN